MEETFSITAYLLDAALLITYVGLGILCLWLVRKLDLLRFLRLHGWHGAVSLGFVILSFLSLSYGRGLDGFAAWNAVPLILASLLITPLLLIWGLVALVKARQRTHRIAAALFTLITLSPPVAVLLG